MPKSANFFRKVLVANRGEIAVRILRALREMRIPSVAVYSEADRSALHVQMADQAVCVGPAASAQSYLSIGAILDAAARTRADAVHPGYGFLSENARFASACTDAGIRFIGPSAAAIERMGSKTQARKVAIAAGAPVVPGTEQGITDAGEARSVAASIGYPVLLKASAGGGGKGMRRVYREGELVAALRDAASEAERAFGSGEVYLEKLIERPRHIEVQILGDEYGHLIHLGERECSIQRRHQKVVEECPAPLSEGFPELREQIGAAALKIAGAVQYTNAGTMEFLADQSGRFYFLEMNTRLQVEHPVTELATGIDLVQWQIRIAAGEPLTVRQSDVRWHGHAIECRVYAEDPETFFPAPGKLSHYREPGGPGIRVDTGVYAGWTVPLEYDPLLAKLCVWAGDRRLALERLARAIDEFELSGTANNLPLFRKLLADDDFRAGNLDTGLLERKRTHLHAPHENAFVAALLAAAQVNGKQAQPQQAAPSNASAWRTSARKDLLR